MRDNKKRTLKKKEKKEAAKRPHFVLEVHDVVMNLATPKPGEKQNG